MGGFVFFGFTFFARCATSSALILQPTRAQNVPHGLDGPAHAALARVEVPAGAGPAAEARRRDIAPGEVGDAGEDGVDVGLDERRARGQDHFWNRRGKEERCVAESREGEGEEKEENEDPPIRFLFFDGFRGSRWGGSEKMKKGDDPGREREK